MKSWYKVAEEQVKSSNKIEYLLSIPYSDMSPDDINKILSVVSNKETPPPTDILTKALYSGGIDNIIAVSAFSNPHTDSSERIKWLVANNYYEILLGELDKPEKLDSYLQDTEALKILLWFIYEACKKDIKKIYYLPIASKIVSAAIKNPETLDMVLNIYSDIKNKINIGQEDKALIHSKTIGEMSEENQQEWADLQDIFEI